MTHQAAAAVLRPSTPLYDLLAPVYDEHFAVPHRRAYDDLAWERCSQVLLPPPGVVVDVGCGVGRWAQRWLRAGYRVVGVEPAHRMASTAARRLAGWDDGRFQLLRTRVEDVDLDPGSVDAVVAMGSLQYTQDPTAVLARAAGWLRPGGAVCVLVDSLDALVLELRAAGRHDEAWERLSTRRGVWRVDGIEADLHLFDADALRAAVASAGLQVLDVRGLLVGASLHGREALTRRLSGDYQTALADERRLADDPALADLGKQLLVHGRRPVIGTAGPTAH